MENNNLTNNQENLEETKSQHEKEVALRERELDYKTLKANKSSEVKNNLINSANNISNSVLESRKLEANTRIELEKIHSNHLTLNNHINKEYKKQKRAMNKASDVIDHGLEKDNLDIIALGLQSLTNVANTNPMANLFNKIEGELSKNIDDDDFMIEI